MNTHITEKWMQFESWERVVDGQLSHAELLELVSACDEHPELWKRCAVAFLEEQALALELRQLAAQWPAIPLNEGEQRTDLRLNDSVKKFCSDKHVIAGRCDHALTEGSRSELQSAIAIGWLNPLGLAASVVLAFLIGWQASQRFGKEVERNPYAEAKQSGGSGNSSSIAQPTLPKQSITVDDSAGAIVQPGDDTVASQPAGDDSSLESVIPSIETTADAIQEALQRPEQFVPLDRTIPPQLAELERRGLVQIESIEGFVPVRLRNGNAAIVPVQQIELRPVHNAY